MGEGVIFQSQIREGMRVIFLVVKGLGTRRHYAMIVSRVWQWALFDICEVRHTYYAFHVNIGISDVRFFSSWTTT